MQVLTNLFDLDKETKLIRCNARQVNKRGFKRKVIIVSEAESNWTNTWKEEIKQNVNFRTEFILYRSEREYLLQIKGVSSISGKYPTKYKVLLFKEPEECMKIITDSENHMLYLSDPVLNLLEDIQKSEYITRWEKERWESCLIDEE